MELRDYLRILGKNWWIILLMTALAIAGTLIFSFSSTPVYESTSTYVVSLESFESIGNTLYGLDTLTSNQQRIFTTYCRLLDSFAIRDEAVKIINVASFDPVAYTATCTVLPETNVLRVIVQGPVPAVVHRLNEAIGIVGIARAKDLYQYFILQNLDPVTLNPVPISPNHAQNATLGAILGLILGVSLAFGREYIRTTNFAPRNEPMKSSSAIELDGQLAPVEIIGGRNG